MTKQPEDLTSHNKADRPAVGPDPGFSQKVLQSFKEKPLSESEIKVKQQQWQQYTKEKEETIKVNDFPKYFYAGFWIRFLAFIVDLICIGSITRLTIGLAAMLIYLGYFILFTKLNHGQTIGKMIFGIRVICFNESDLSWTTVLVREGACRFILKFPLLFVGYLPTIFNQRKQHIGDYFSNTSVVTLNLVKAFNQEINA